MPGSPGREWRELSWRRRGIVVEHRYQDRFADDLPFGEGPQALDDDVAQLVDRSEQEAAVRPGDVACVSTMSTRSLTLTARSSLSTRLSGPYASRTSRTSESYIGSRLRRGPRPRRRACGRRLRGGRRRSTHEGRPIREGAAHWARRERCGAAGPRSRTRTRGSEPGGWPRDPRCPHHAALFVGQQATMVHLEGDGLRQAQRSELRCERQPRQVARPADAAFALPVLRSHG